MREKDKCPSYTVALQLLSQKKKMGLSHCRYLVHVARDLQNISRVVSCEKDKTVISRFDLPSRVALSQHPNRTLEQFSNKDVFCGGKKKP